MTQESTTESSMGDALPVTVVRSSRRRKTVEAKILDGGLRVSIPSTFTEDEERHWIGVMQERVLRKRATGLIDLRRRAAELAGRYRLPHPASIAWSERQQQRWGSCTPADRSIRISTRMAGMPAWVLDYVIVHELAHLVESGHGPDFAALVNRYPKAERARGYLIAKSEDG